jgi:Ca2+-binding RTX toxin-like protein
MSRIRLLAVFAAALMVLAFAGTALARGGSPGDDNVTGSDRGDRIALEAGDDHASGGRGDDVINGGRGNDVLRGGLGDDRVHGGSGDDVLADDRGSDRLYGGAGDDRLDARDRRGRNDRRDVVNCGSGDDTATVDRDDVVIGCEHVTRTAHDAGDDHGVHAPGTDDHGRGRGTDDGPNHT